MKHEAWREWSFVGLWATFVILLANLPYIYGYAIAPSDKEFMGDARCFIDTNSYLAWMAQAADGEVLFKDIYTTEPHARMLFHPLFLLLGNVSKMTGLSLIAVHACARVFFGLLLLLMIYLFVSRFVETLFEKRFTFVLVSLSGGLAWLKLLPSIDTLSESWFLTGWVEGNTFLSIYALPLFSASILMLLAVFHLMLKAFETAKLKYACWAGGICLLLITTHFFDALIVYPVIGIYLLVKHRVLKEPRSAKKEILALILMALISMASPLYNFWASLKNPVFYQHAWEAAITLSPGFIWYLAFLGFLALLAVIGIGVVLSDKGHSLFARRLFLVVWALSVPFLIYSPISFQRRLIEGVHVPMAILSAIGILFLIRRFQWNPQRAAIGFILLLIPGNLTVLYKDMHYLKGNAQIKSVAGFLDKDIVRAILWLKENTRREEVILTDYEIGNYIPALSGNTVFIGHSPQTLNFPQKWALTKRFFDPTENHGFRQSFLEKNGIRYIFYSWKERRIGRFLLREAPYLKPVYQKGSVEIYRVK